MIESYSNLLKNILVLSLAMMAGCKGQFQSSAEKAIEEKQNQEWIQRVNEATDFALIWKINSAKEPNTIGEGTALELGKKIEDFKLWKDKIQIEGKISPVPSQLREMVDQSDNNFIKTIDIYTQASERIKKENEEKEKRELQELHDASIRMEKVMTDFEAAQKKRLADQNEEMARQEVNNKIAAQKRQVMLEKAFATSKAEEIPFEERRALWHQTNTMKVLADPSGQNMKFLSSSDDSYEVLLRIQNVGTRKSTYYPKDDGVANQIFFTFTAQEFPQGKDCNATFGKNYIFKKLVNKYIYPGEIQDTKLQIPKFLENACWHVLVEG